MKFVYSTLILTVLFCASTAPANFNLNTSDVPVINTNIIKSDISAVNSTDWVDVNLTNGNPDYNPTLFNYTSANQLASAFGKTQHAPLVHTATFTYSNTVKADFTSSGNEFVGKASINSSTQRDTTVTDPASILLFCFGVGITSLTAIRKKFVRLQHHSVH